MAKWLIARLQTKWFWVQVQFQSLESKLSVINKKSLTILELPNSKRVNLILLFKGKSRRPSHIFGFYCNITQKINITLIRELTINMAIWIKLIDLQQLQVLLELELRFKNILMISISIWCAS